MTYTPNFRDARVRSRCLTSLSFVVSRFGVDRPRHCSRAEINQHLGQAQTDLGSYLYDALLSCADKYYSPSKHVSMRYTLNLAALEYVWSQAKPEQYSNVVDYTIYDQYTRYASEMASGDFPYKKKTHRLWHPAQNIRSAIRPQVFALGGYHWDYDIQSCAPTLLTQYAHKCGAPELPHLAAYLEDTKAHRDHWASQLSIGKRDIKILLNSLMCGSRLGNSHHYSTWPLLQQDPARVALAQTHLADWRSDVRIMWQHIINTENPRREFNARGHRKPVTPGDKWRIYFRLEEQVMNSLRDHTRSQGIYLYNEHDGIRTNNQIDTRQASNQVYNTTGYHITLTNQ